MLSAPTAGGAAAILLTSRITCDAGMLPAPTAMGAARIFYFRTLVTVIQYLTWTIINWQRGQIDGWPETWRYSQSGISQYKEVVCIIYIYIYM